MRRYENRVDIQNGLGHVSSLGFFRRKPQQLNFAGTLAMLDQGEFPKALDHLNQLR